MKINDGFIVREVNNSKILVNKQNPKKIVKLNETATEIFIKLQEGLDFEGIVSFLCDKCGIEGETAEQGVKSTIDRLIAVGVVSEDE